MTPQYTPMSPTLVREPFHRPGWVYEEKVDGWRMLAYKDGDILASSAATASTTRGGSAISRWRSRSCSRSTISSFAPGSTGYAN